MPPVTWTAHDESDEIAKYWALYEQEASRFVGVKRADFDDLVQEAAIAGWKAIRNGYKPNPTIVRRACMKYVRSLHKGGWRLVSESW